MYPPNVRLAPNKSISGQLILSEGNVEWGAVEAFVHQRGVALFLSTAPTSVVKVIFFEKSLVFAVIVNILDILYFCSLKSFTFTIESKYFYPWNLFFLLKCTRWKMHILFISMVWSQKSEMTYEKHRFCSAFYNFNFPNLKSFAN